MAKKNQNTPSSGGTMAIHAEHEDGVHHAIGIWDLHVYITRDGDGWFAQGLEIDYGVQGDTVEEAKRNFEIGLEGTIDLHLRVDRNIMNLLRLAPIGVIQDALRNRMNGHIEAYSQVTFHEAGINASLPFDGISYLVAAASVEEAIAA